MPLIRVLLFFSTASMVEYCALLKNWTVVQRWRHIDLAMASKAMEPHLRCMLYYIVVVVALFLWFVHVVWQLDSLSRRELASRLTLNCRSAKVEVQQLSDIPVTIIDASISLFFVCNAGQLVELCNWLVVCLLIRL
jgi:hypothetical protein